MKKSSPGASNKPVKQLSTKKKSTYSQPALKINILKQAVIEKLARKILSKRAGAKVSLSKFSRKTRVLPPSSNEFDKIHRRVLDRTMPLKKQPYKPIALRKQSPKPTVDKVSAPPPPPVKYRGNLDLGSKAGPGSIIAGGW